MERQHYGITDDGQSVDAYTLANAAGMRVCILTLGCIIARLEVPDRDGRLAKRPAASLHPVLSHYRLHQTPRDQLGPT